MLGLRVGVFGREKDVGGRVEVVVVVVEGEGERTLRLNVSVWPNGAVADESPFAWSFSASSFWRTSMMTRTDAIKFS